MRHPFAALDKELDPLFDEFLGLGVTNRQPHQPVGCERAGDARDYDCGDHGGGGRPDAPSIKVSLDSFPANITKLLTAPGAPCTVTATGPDANGDYTVTYAAGTPALKVYKVKDADAANTLFAVTKNYTYDTALVSTNSPFGDKGFVLVRKGGDASILRKNNATAITGQEATFQSTVGKRPGDVDGAGGVGAGDNSQTLTP